jgi:hypothetical protein
MEKNCQWYNEVYIIGSSNPFGLVYDPLDYNTTGSYISGGVQAGSPWMQDFMTGVWGYAKALNLPISGTASSRLSAFYAWKAQNIVGKLGDSSGFWYVNAAVYAFANSPVSQPNYYSALGTTGPWYNSWKEIYDATYTNNTVTVNGLSNTEGVLGGEYFPENPPPSMWHNMQPAIAYAVRHGITGALTSYNRMVNASNWSSLLAGFSVNPVWGVMPSSGATSSATAFTLSCVTTGITGTPVTVTVTPDGPVPSTIVVTLAATNSGVLGTTTLSFTSGSSTAQSTTLTRSIDGASSLSITNNGGLSNAGTPITFTTTSSSSFPTWLSSASIGVWSQISSTSSPAEVGHFSGVALREELGIIEIFSGANGGHGGNLTNNRVLTLRLDLNTPTWVQRRAGSDATGWDTTGASGPYLPDGRPAPRHTYFDMFWSPERQRYLVGGRFWGSGAYDWGTTYDSFNPVTNDWDTAGTVSKTDSIMLSSRDPSTGILYNLNGYQYNPATNTLSTWNLTGSAALNRGSSAFDTTRNVMYHLSCGDNFGGPDSTLVSTKVTTGGVKTAITFNASSGWTSFQTDFPTTITAALTYDKDLDYYYYYMGNPAVGTQKIYRIKPNSTTVWDIDIMPVSGLTPASSFGGGVMNKFVYISSLGACVLVVGGQDVYFIRTSTPVPIQPTWLNSIAVNQWTTIPGTIMAGSPAAPGEDPLDYYFATGRTLAYSGMALREDTSELILAANGGHNDSSDNRVISIGINADSPAWQLRKAASLSGNRVIDAAYYLDGLPTSRHTYWSTQWIASRSRVMLPRTRFAYGNAVSFNNANGFNLTNNTWDAQGTWSDGSSVQCKDASDAMWAMSGTTLQKWTAATDTWSQTANFGGSAMPQGPMTYDSNRNQLFALAWGDGQAGGTGVTAYIFNSTGTTRTTITFNASSAYTQFQTDGPAYAALEYNPVTDKFYFYEGKSGITTRVYVVIPNGTTVWDMQILSVTGVTPPANYGGSGVMNRFRYVPALKGFVYLASGTDLLYFLKTS